MSASAYPSAVAVAVAVPSRFPSRGARVIPPVITVDDDAAFRASLKSLEPAAARCFAKQARYGEGVLVILHIAIDLEGRTHTVRVSQSCAGSQCSRSDLDLDPWITEPVLACMRGELGSRPFPSFGRALELVIDVIPVIGSGR